MDRPDSAQPGQTLYLASIGSRFAALILDLILFGIATGILTMPLRIVLDGQNLVEQGVDIVLWIGYQTLFVSRGGQTLGKMLLNIKVVTPNGSVPSQETALIRAATQYLSFVVALVGYAWALFNPKKQTWHDLFANTYVVEAAPKTNP